MLNLLPSNSRIEYLYRFMDDMSDKELSKELDRSSLKQNGSRKQKVKRLRDHYRQGLIDLRRNRNLRTENFYDYFIAIDFECTCEKDQYKYDHEIIEFPAVLISVQSRRIVDSFRTIIRPRKNPKLTEFCTKLTGITQEMVNQAPTFPEALLMFRGWMSKHGLDGINNRGTCRRFCYVTDGPWDIVKFLQSDCLKWEVPVPHDFRVFLNLRRAFINFYCHPRPGNPKPSRLPVADLREMLKRLDLTFEGHEHCGMDDTANIARILIRMLHDGAELRVNEKLVNGEHLLPWHEEQLVFKTETDDGDQQKQQQQQPKASSSEDDEIMIASSGMASLRIAAAGDNGGRPASVKRAASEEEVLANLQRLKLLAKDKWWERLPYKLVRISRNQFLGELFLECESCDEEPPEEEEE